MALYISKLAKDKKARRRELKGWMKALSAVGQEWANTGRKSAIEAADSVTGSVKEITK